MLNDILASSEIRSATEEVAEELAEVSSEVPTVSLTSSLLYRCVIIAVPIIKVTSERFRPMINEQARVKS